MRPLEPCFCNAVWHLRSLSARSSLGDLRSSLQVVPPRRRFWRLLARVVLVCFGVVPSLPWAISRAGSGRTGSSRRALHGPQNLLGIGDWLLLPTACHTQAYEPSAGWVGKKNAIQAPQPYMQQPCDSTALACARPLCARFLPRRGCRGPRPGAAKRRKRKRQKSSCMYL